MGEFVLEPCSPQLCSCGVKLHTKRTKQLGFCSWCWKKTPDGKAYHSVRAAEWRKTLAKTDPERYRQWREARQAHRKQNQDDWMRRMSEPRPLIDGECRGGCGRRLRPHNKSGVCQDCMRWSADYHNKALAAQRERLRLMKSDPVKLAKYRAYKIADERRRVSTVEGKLRSLIDSARGRCKKTGLPFDLSVADLMPTPAVCPVLGLTLTYAGTGALGAAPKSASLDRIVPALGYVRGNVRIISWRANSLRKNGSTEELCLVATDALRIEKLRVESALKTKEK